MEGAPDRRAALASGALLFGVRLEDAAADRLLAYLDRLLVVNETLNLTGVRDPLEAVERHLLDSLAFGLHVRESGPPRRVVDVGTGGGFPGVPIAVAWPSCEVHLIDATRKKVDAVRGILEEAGIGNVLVHWSRAEDLRDGAAADAVTARAIGSLAVILRQTSHLLARGGALVCWKSDELPEGERAEACSLLRRFGMESLPDLEYELGRKRRLVRFRRTR